MDRSEFRDLYRKAKTWADLDEVWGNLVPRELQELQSALQVTKDYTGLDMRQEFLLNCINGYLKTLV